MASYTLRRVAQAVFVVWAAYTLTFAIVYLLPGDPVSVMLSGPGGEQGFVSEEAREALRAELGLDRPLVVQYLTAVGDALRGDLGVSVMYGKPVTGLLLDVLPNTLTLGAAAVGLSLVLGTGIALVATYTRLALLREALLALPPVAVSAPTFWTGLVLVQVVSFQLGWLPAIGDRGWQTLVLPVLTLAIPTSAALAQVLAKSLRTTLTEPFVATARAKGASRARTLLRHAGRNGALPALTVLGLTVANTFAGAVVVETVFARRGVGRLTATAVASQDLPVVLGVVVCAAVVFAIVNLATDLAYPWFNPRVTSHVRAGAGSGAGR